MWFHLLSSSPLILGSGCQSFSEGWWLIKQKPPLESPVEIQLIIIIRVVTYFDEVDWAGIGYLQLLFFEVVKLSLSSTLMVILNWIVSECSFFIRTTLAFAVMFNVIILYFISLKLFASARVKVEPHLLKISWAVGEVGLESPVASI